MHIITILWNGFIKFSLKVGGKRMKSKEKIYGETFKGLRQGQGISDKEACKGVCSRSTLCRFETGESDISLSKFADMLDNIKISAEEYFAAVKNYEPSDDEILFQRTKKYYDERDDKMLKKFRSSIKKENNLKTLMLSILINDLDKNFVIPDQDFENVSDYLMNVETWSYSKVQLLNNVIHRLNINLACSVTRDLLKIKKKFLINDYRKTQLIKILLNVSYSCVRHGYMEDASVFLEEAEALMATQRIENCIAAKYCLRFIKGFFFLSLGETEDGMALMRKAVDNFRSTEDKEIIERYEQYYKEALEQVGMKSEAGE
jgi:Rgg/GadR/MutR family transcriptional activator